jgi:hypothetical protein
MKLPKTVLHERSKAVKTTVSLAFLGDNDVLQEALRLSDLFCNANSGKPKTRNHHVGRVLKELVNRISLSQGKLVILPEGEIYFGKS